MVNYQCAFLKRRGYIYIRVANDGLRFEVSTKTKLPDKCSLHPEIGVEGKTKLASDINVAIRGKRAEVMEKIEEAHSAGGEVKFLKVKNYVLGIAELPSKRITFHNILKDIKARYSQERVVGKDSGKLLKPGTISTRLTIVKRLIKCCKALDLDFETYNSFTAKVHGPGVVSNKYKKLIEGIKLELINADLNDSTISMDINMLRGWIKDACKDGNIYLGSLLDTLKYKAPKYAVITMTNEQSQFVLHNYDKIISECQSEKEEYAVDYWVAAILTMARVSDIDSWTRNKLIRVGDKNYLKFIMKKTEDLSAKQVAVPVVDLLMKIFRKNMFKYNGKLMPKYFPHLNDRLRDVAIRYDVFNVPITKVRIKGGKKVGTEMDGLKMYDVLHFHMMRGTTITHMLESGTPSQVVKEFSGHTTNSRSFERYVGGMSSEAKDRAYEEYKKRVAI